MIILNRARQVGQRDVCQQSVCGRINLSSRNAAAVTEERARACGTGRWIVEHHARSAEISVALIFSRHGGENIYRRFFSFMLVIDEEKCEIRAVIDMRNLERPADVCANALVVMINLRRRRTCNGVGLRIPDRIFVTIREAEAHAIDSLARKSAAAAPSATSSWRTASSRSTAGPTCSAGALKAAALSAEWISALLPRRLTWHAGNATASGRVSNA